MGAMRHMTLLEYMHATGLRRPPPCYYCGGRAVLLDHVRPKTGPPKVRGSHRRSNLKPACRRCNGRKGARTLDVFRAGLERIAKLGGIAGPITFYGEGARGPALGRLQRILGTMTLVRGRLRIVAEGEPLRPPPSETARERQAELGRLRWRGRFTFVGYRALRDLAARAGCSFPVVERFIMGRPVQAESRLVEACHALRLDRGALRVLKPKSARKA